MYSCNDALQNAGSSSQHEKSEAIQAPQARRQHVPILKDKTGNVVELSRLSAKDGHVTQPEVTHKAASTTKTAENSNTSHNRESNASEVSPESPPDESATGNKSAEPQILENAVEAVLVGDNEENQNVTASNIPESSISVEACSSTSSVVDANLSSDITSGGTMEMKIHDVENTLSERHVAKPEEIISNVSDSEPHDMLASPPSSEPSSSSFDLVSDSVKYVNNEISLPETSESNLISDANVAEAAQSFDGESSSKEAETTGNSNIVQQQQIDENVSTGNLSISDHSPVEGASGDVHSKPLQSDVSEDDWEDAVVDLSVQPLKVTSTSALAPVTNVSPPVAVAAVSANPGKKSHSKKKWAEKDKISGDSLNLDAYREVETLPKPAPTPAPVVPATRTSPSVMAHVAKPENMPPSADIPASQFRSQDEKNKDDEWEAPKNRSLRPGGGAPNKKLNEGPMKPSEKARLVYGKEELLKLKPTVMAERPANLALYANFASMGSFSDKNKAMQDKGDKGGLGAASQGKGPAAPAGTGESRWGKQSQEVLPRYPQYPPHAYPPQQPGGFPDDRNLPMGMNPGYPPVSPSAGGSALSWQRSQMPPAPQDKLLQASKKGRVAVPMPKKQITDPVEIMTRDVQAILNKITPQTFQKLTMQLCEIPIDTNAMLDKLIQLVFEKAVQEPNFANLYAEMCAALDNESRYWAFLQVTSIRIQCIT